MDGWKARRNAVRGRADAKPDTRPKRGSIGGTHAAANCVADERAHSGAHARADPVAHRASDRAAFPRTHRGTDGFADS